MYSDRIEKLIELAIIDGVLSDKECEVLYRKAKDEGIDIEEFKIVLEGKLFIKQKQLSNSTNTPFHHSILNDQNIKNLNDVRRCPACNDILQLFVTSCTSCNYELNYENIESVTKNILLELSKLDLKNKRNGNNALLNAFSDSNSSSLDHVNEKCELIKNCIIPNTKFEILSFLSIAIPLVEKNKPKSKWNFGISGNDPDEKISNAWKKKCEQVIIQAQFSMQSDKIVLGKILEYSKKLGI